MALKPKHCAALVAVAALAGFSCSREQTGYELELALHSRHGALLKTHGLVLPSWPMGFVSDTPLKDGQGNYLMNQQKDAILRTRCYIVKKEPDDGKLYEACLLTDDKSFDSNQITVTEGQFSPR
jgi:hypothetical protein